MAAALLLALALFFVYKPVNNSRHGLAVNPPAKTPDTINEMPAPPAAQTQTAMVAETAAAPAPQPQPTTRRTASKRTTIKPTAAPDVTAEPPAAEEAYVIINGKPVYDAEEGLEITRESLSLLSEGLMATSEELKPLLNLKITL